MLPFFVAISRVYMLVDEWCLVHSQAKTPIVLCIVHVGKNNEEMYFLSAIVIIRQKIMLSVWSLYACVVGNNIRGSYVLKVPNTCRDS